MGLFGSSPQKKLEKGRALLSAASWYEAKRLFEDVLAAGAKVGDGERSEARSGLLRCRREMMAQRMEEAETLLRAGDVEGARDRAETAGDLAGDDLDDSGLRELLQRIEAPARPFTGGGLEAAAAQDDLLPPEAPRAPQTARRLLDRPRPEPEPVPDEEFYGGDPAALFELHLESMRPRTAEYFRGLGEAFRLGYLATVGGEGVRALRHFDRMDWSEVRHPAALRARANALLLAGRAEECLELLDSMAPPAAAETPASSPGEPAAPVPDEDAGKAANELPEGVTEEDVREYLAGEGERRYMRIEALRALKRLEDAVEAARALADAQAEPRLATEALLGWTLIEAGRTEDAWRRLQERLKQMGYHEEILVPAAQAAVALGDEAEARRMLEELIQFRMERSLARGHELDFPVEAGRKLLEIYLQVEEEPSKTRALVLHLLDQDADRAEEYRSILLELDGKR